MVERTIAHIKSWRIHPHRLQEILGNIRADHHRGTRTLRLQNHPLNNLQRHLQGISQPRTRRTPLDALLAQTDERGGEPPGVRPPWYSP